MENAQFSGLWLDRSLVWRWWWSLATHSERGLKRTEPYEAMPNILNKTVSVHTGRSPVLKQINYVYFFRDNQLNQTFGNQRRCSMYFFYVSNIGTSMSDLCQIWSSEFSTVNIWMCLSRPDKRQHVTIFCLKFFILFISYRSCFIY